MDRHNIPTSVMNAKILDALDRDQIKVAEDAATSYTRTGVREGSFAFKILPAEKATDDMLDRALDERLQIIWELEPESPAAKWVPFQTVPDGEYITGSRYIIPFARILTPKFVKDIDELRTYRQDLRKILTDNSIKDGLAAIDTKFMETVNSIVFNADGPWEDNKVTGKVQWRAYDEPLNRRTFTDALKMLPKGNDNGQFRLRNHICLMNEVTAKDWLALGRDEVGGDLAESHFKSGLTSDEFFGLKALFTIKDDLVPDGYVYFFAAPEFLGKAFYMTDWTMYMKKEFMFIEMFSSWLGGMAFGNVAGMAVATFGDVDVAGRPGGDDDDDGG